MLDDRAKEVVGQFRLRADSGNLIGIGAAVTRRPLANKPTQHD
jgi:hypothetical protein